MNTEKLKKIFLNTVIFGTTFSVGYVGNGYYREYTKKAEAAKYRKAGDREWEQFYISAKSINKRYDTKIDENYNTLDVISSMFDQESQLKLREESAKIRDDIAKLEQERYNDLGREAAATWKKAQIMYDKADSVMNTYSR